MKKERLNEIWGVLFLLLGLFTLASLAFFDKGDLSFYTSHPNSPVHNYTGVTGAYLAFGLLLAFGISAYLIPAIFLLWSGCFFMQKVPERKLFKVAGLAIALVSTATIIAICSPEASRFDHAGTVGYLAGMHLLKYFGFLGSFILAASCLLLSLLLATDFLLYPLARESLERFHGGLITFIEKTAWVGRLLHGLFKWLGAKPKEVDAWQEKPEPKASKQKQKQKKTFEPVPMPDAPPLKVTKYQPDVAEEEEEVEPVKGKDKKQDKKPVPALEEKSTRPVIPPAVAQNKAEGEEGKHDGVIGSAAVDATEYQMPGYDLLRRPEPPGEVKNEDLQGKSRILEEALAKFGIQVKVTEIEQGPVITRYELMPAPGVKVSSIAALSDDLALALKAMSIRLIIPIPGKNAIGVEVPNSVSSTVSVRELLETSQFRHGKAALPLALGKDTSGRPMIGDLADMPHILIAGTTGSGKTVCVNSVITGLLYKRSPQELKFVMVDPKMVELAVYNKIPHMLTPVVTNVKKAAHTLNWVVSEMENRYQLFANVGVRNISAFNSREISEEDQEQLEEAEESENVIPAKIPYIVVVIDELADLMMVAQDKVEGAITRLAQLSRAVGIHLLLATQRPSVDVITGVIKANFPARISFKVASKVDSRTVLDAMGAEKLIGKGDMLFMKPGDERATRGQACLILDQEINDVVEFWANQGKPEFHAELLSAQAGKSVAGAGVEKDELFDEAVAVVLETGQASTSNLQRRLRLGYTRAARIIDQMENEGLVGPAQGAKPRDIYIGSESSEAVSNG